MIFLGFSNGFFGFLGFSRIIRDFEAILVDFLRIFLGILWIVWDFWESEESLKNPK